MIERWVLLVAGVFAVSCAGSRPDPVCHNEVSADPQRREVRTDEWFTLLLRGQDRDCRGIKIEVTPLAEKCAAFEEQGEPLPLEALGDNNLIVNRVDRNKRLVWAITRRFSNGEGIGPIALADVSADGIAITALGTMRGLTAGAKMRLHPVGEGRKAGEVVTLEGGKCDGTNAEDCRRYLVLLARRSTALTGEHLEDVQGKCVGPARIDLARKKRFAIDNGWQREVELVASASYTPDGLLIHEVVTVREMDPKKRDTTIKEVRRAEGDRSIRWVDGLLVVSEASLWERMAK